MIFLVQRSCDSSSLKRGIVNFARHHGRDVYRALAESGLASQLLYCGPAYPDCVKPTLLVMEFVDDRTLEAPEPTVTERETVQTVLRSAVATLQCSSTAEHHAEGR